MRERHHAIHVARQLFPGVTRRDQFGRVRRAVTGRHYRDVIACAHAAILALVTEKRWHSGGWGREGNVPGREFVIELQLLERYVVRVDVPAGFDAHAGAAHQLAITNHTVP